MDQDGLIHVINDNIVLFLIVLNEWDFLSIFIDENTLWAHLIVNIMDGVLNTRVDSDTWEARTYQILKVIIPNLF